ncbi:MAG: hypothetical protein Q4G09_07055 [Clostridia bacterium]|nr:hypothetical protein [Clostridia bacterium]
MIDVKIDLDKVVLLGEKISLEVSYFSKFETKWMLVKEIENKIFCLKSNEMANQSTLPKNIKDTYIVIDLEKRIREKIRYIINKEFEKLFQNNNRNYILEYESEVQRSSNGRKIGITRNYPMLNKSYLFGKNIRDDEYKTRYMNLDISDIDKGIIYVLENRTLQYNILQDAFQYSDNTILKEFYNEEELKQILSFEQYKRGLTPLVYNEIAKINNFIKDVKTVTVELKNGTAFKTNATLNNILQINSDGKIYIAKTYYQKIIKGTDFEDQQYLADEINSIKFNKFKLDINGQNLTMLNENVDEMTINKIDKNEETEEILEEE